MLVSSFGFVFSQHNFSRAKSKHPSFRFLLWGLNLRSCVCLALSCISPAFFSFEQSVSLFSPCAGVIIMPACWKREKYSHLGTKQEARPPKGQNAARHPTSAGHVRVWELCFWSTWRWEQCCSFAGCGDKLTPSFPGHVLTAQGWINRALGTLVPRAGIRLAHRFSPSTSYSWVCNERANYLLQGGLSSEVIKDSLDDLQGSWQQHSGQTPFIGKRALSSCGQHPLQRAHQTPLIDSCGQNCKSCFQKTTRLLMTRILQNHEANRCIEWEQLRRMDLIGKKQFILFFQVLRSVQWSHA